MKKYYTYKEYAPGPTPSVDPEKELDWFFAYDDEADEVSILFVDGTTRKIDDEVMRILYKDRVNSQYCEQVYPKFAFYSQDAADNFGHCFWLDFSGNSIKVTSVYDDIDANGYLWPDKRFVGLVSKCISVNEKKNLFFDHFCDFTDR